MAVDVPLRRLFDYRCPSGVDAARLQPGQRLWVPFGRQRVAAVLVELASSSTVPEAKLRSATALIDETPVLDPSLLELLLWSAEYYRHPPGEVLSAALPGALRTGAAARDTADHWTLSAAARTGELPPLPSRAHKPREVVEFMQRHEAADEAALGVHKRTLNI